MALAGRGGCSCDVEIFHRVLCVFVVVEISDMFATFGRECEQDFFFL